VSTEITTQLLSNHNPGQLPHAQTGSFRRTGKLTPVIDRTYLPGFHISLEAPSATSVALALAMAVLPKNKFLAAQHIDFDWPCQGLPKAVHLDNAREFHSNALKRGYQEHGLAIYSAGRLFPSESLESL
jgi:transposase InsO family protein